MLEGHWILGGGEEVWKSFSYAAVVYCFIDLVVLEVIGLFLLLALCALRYWMIDDIWDVFIRFYSILLSLETASFVLERVESIHRIRGLVRLLVALIMAVDILKSVWCDWVLDLMVILSWVTFRKSRWWLFNERIVVSMVNFSRVLNLTDVRD